MDVALIGVGLVGAAIAERYQRAGLAVIGYDPRPEACDSLRQIGSTVADSSVFTAKSAPIVVLSLPDSDVVERVVADIEPVLQGRTVIDTTTGDPDRTAALGARLRKKGIDYLDATIAGSSAQVRDGSAMVLAGGKSQVFQRVKPLVGHIAERVFHVGPWGNGARMKLVFNLVLGLNRAVLAEGLTFAKSSGLDPNVAFQILQGGAAHSRVMDTKGPKMLSGDFAPVARLSQHHKDVRLILAAAKRSGIELPLSQVHDELLTRAEDRGYADADNSAIIRAYE